VATARSSGTWPNAIGEIVSSTDRLVTNVEQTRWLRSAGTGVDDLVLPNRDELTRALGDLAVAWDGGPYSERARVLLSRYAPAIDRLLPHYDRLVDEARVRPGRMVLTHGEPHVENVIRTPAGRLLVDWDTALIAPPERDLWTLESGDGSVIESYTEATGALVLSSMLELYRLRWDLAEIAIYVALFRRPHIESADTRESWKNLNHCLNSAGRRPSCM